MAKLKWTTDKLKAEALKYTTRIEFQNGNKGAYLSARRQKLLDFICSHMDPQRKSWDRGSVKSEALKYKSKSEFHKNASAAYRWAKKEHVFEDVTSHMEDPKTIWTFSTIKEEALNFKTRNEFKKNSSSAYQAALKLGVIGDVCSHMKPPQKAWTLEQIELAAKKYVRRNEFKRKDYGCYQAAHRLGVIDSICSHMEYDHLTFNYKIPAFLYYVKITTKDGSLPTVYKVGITGRSYVLDRFYNDYLVTTTEIEVIHKRRFSTGTEAFNKEQLIKNIYKQYAYEGQSPLVQTKTTEMFTQGLPGIHLYFKATEQQPTKTE